MSGSTFEIIDLVELLKRLAKYNHREIHIHHTEIPNQSQWRARPDPMYWQKAMRDYHMKTNGWQDIAQHVTLLPDGKFVTGRKFNINPASMWGAENNNVFMVEMFGNFDKGKDKFQGAQKEAAIELARWFDNRGKYVRFHRENSDKTCPGSSIDKTEFMNEVRKLTYGQALDILADKVGISKAYWLPKEKIDTYFGDLIIKIANYIKGVKK